MLRVHVRVHVRVRVRASVFVCFVVWGAHRKILVRLNSEGLEPEFAGGAQDSASSGFGVVANSGQ